MTRVILDVDSVAADFTTPILRECEKYVDHALTDDDITSFDILESVGVPDDCRSRVWAAAKKEFFVAGLKPYRGVKQAVKRLQTAGVEIYAVTSPLADAPHWHLEREQWCAFHMGLIRNQVVHCHDKWIVTADYIVDDKGETLVRWQQAHPDGLAIKLRRPWNRHLDAKDGIRAGATTLGAAVDLILEDIERKARS